MNTEDHEIKFDGRTLLADVVMWHRGKNAAAACVPRMGRVAKGPLLRMVLVGLAVALPEQAALLRGPDRDRDCTTAFLYRILLNTDETAEVLMERLRAFLDGDRKTFHAEIGDIEPADARAIWEAARDAGKETDLTKMRARPWRKRTTAAEWGRS